MNTEATHDQNEALTTGARLRNAREQLGLSQQAVAERLCLKVSTVRDIEEDKAPADLASTFSRRRTAARAGKAGSTTGCKSCANAEFFPR